MPLHCNERHHAERTGEVIVRSDLHGPTNVTKCLPIRMVHFKALITGDVSKVAARSKGTDAKHTLAEYKPFFALLDENYRTVLMARFSRSQEDTTDIRDFIKDNLDFVRISKSSKCRRSEFRVGGTTQATCARRARVGAL